MLKHIEELFDELHHIQQEVDRLERAIDKAQALCQHKQKYDIRGWYYCESCGLEW